MKFGIIGAVVFVILSMVYFGKRKSSASSMREAS